MRRLMQDSRTSQRPMRAWATIRGSGSRGSSSSSCASWVAMAPMMRLVIARLAATSSGVEVTSSSNALSIQIASGGTSP